VSGCVVRRAPVAVWTPWEPDQLGAYRSPACFTARLRSAKWASRRSSVVSAASSSVTRGGAGCCILCSLAGASSGVAQLSQVYQSQLALPQAVIMTTWGGHAAWRRHAELCWRRGRDSTRVDKIDSLAGVVQDDGQGLGTSDQPDCGPHHLGVEGMKQRARLAGGHIAINSPHGQGVRVAFSFPTSDPSNWRSARRQGTTDTRLGVARPYGYDRPPQA
jgi:hypothetical protein